MFWTKISGFISLEKDLEHTARSKIYQEIDSEIKKFFNCNCSLIKKKRKRENKIKEQLKCCATKVQNIYLQTLKLIGNIIEYLNDFK